MTSFYSVEELRELGFKAIGENVQISRKTSIYGAEKMVIGNNVRIDDFCLLSGNVTLGNYVHIAAYAALFAGDYGIEMKDYTGLSSRSCIYAVTDDYSGEVMTNPTVPGEYKNVIGGKVVVEEHVVIGSGSTILPGVVIGEGSSVGSMSLVNKSVDAWGIYVGIPCKKIKDRSKKLLEYAEKIENGMC